MASWAITFGGLPVVSGGEGGYGFTPGIASAQRWRVVPLARGGRVAKRLGTAWATHRLTIWVFAASAATIEARIAALGALTDPATLVIPGRNAYANCVMMPPEQGEQTRMSLNGVSGEGIKYDFIFEQLGGG